MARKKPFFVSAAATVAAGLFVCTACGGSSSGNAAASTTTPVTAATTSSTAGTPTQLPYVEAASVAACAADALTIKQAEDYYSTLNGSFATMAQLVQQKFLRTASVYYPEVIVGQPAGGYTLVATTQKCDNLRLPVAGSN
jgi:hypothetical protein